MDAAVKRKINYGFCFIANFLPVIFYLGNYRLGLQLRTKATKFQMFIRSFYK